MIYFLPFLGPPHPLQEQQADPPPSELVGRKQQNPHVRKRQPKGGLHRRDVMFTTICHQGKVHDLFHKVASHFEKKVLVA